MFRKLRNRFVILNMSIISAILVVAFGAIYVTSYQMEKLEQDQMRVAPVITLRHRLFSEVEQRMIADERIDDSNRALGRLLVTLVSTGVATLILVFGVSWYFAEESIRPVREAWNRQRQFIADASHELKTPLAAMDANFEALMTGQKIRNKWTLNIRRELEMMDRLVRDLLYLARVEDGDVPLSNDKVNLSAEVDDLVVAMETQAYEKGVKIESVIGKKVIITGDREKIRQVMMILSDNAIKYSEAKIEVCLKKSKGKVVFAMKNDGQRIEAEDLPRIFDRFYRSDKSRNSNGYGLGLAIAKTTVERMGGMIGVQSGDMGTVFEVVL